MTRSVLKILFRFAMPYRAALPVLVALGLTASLAEGLGIGLLIPVLSSMLGADGVGSAGPFARAMESVGRSVPDESRFFLLSLLIAALVAFKTLVLVVNVRMASRINGNVTRDLRVGLARRVLEMDFGDFRRHDSGQLMNLLDVQTYRTSEAVLPAVSMLTPACFLPIFATLLVLISWQLALVVIMVALPVSMFVRTRSRRAHAMVADLDEAAGRPADAEAELSRALNAGLKGPLSIELLFRLGRVLEAQGREKEAANAYERGAAAPDKKNAFRLSALARCAAYYEKTKQVVRAMDAYRDISVNSKDRELAAAAAGRASQLEAGRKRR